ncbi:MAG: hypothetical protein GXP03_05560, partial [Alphaproteobacteria bacterium]|nr:hypothetical protein [Alphaproteobacteria bacterium]
MSGNAMEEGLIAQIHNPSHTDPARIGFLGGAILGFVTARIVVLFVPLATVGFVFIWIIVGLFLGAFFTAKLNARIKRREAAEMLKARET